MAHKFLHVVVSLKDRDGEMFLFGDLSSKELKKRFLRPYRRGKPVMTGSTVVDLSSVQSVRIIETEEPKEQALERAHEEDRKATERFNRNSDVFFSGRLSWSDEDIAQCGRNVTGIYVSDPPGQGTRLTQIAGILINPWIYVPATGALVALFTRWLELW